MRYTTEQMYQLLPAIYRLRDLDQGEPLKAVMAILAEQAALLEKDVGSLYENWFIETCEEWVVPYLGDLLGVRGLYPVSEATFSHRARVANTLGYRRRKGTASMLEQLARDTTGWPSRVVEFFQLLGTTQHVNHVRLQNHRAPNVRDGNAMEWVDGPFETVTHTVDVRRQNQGQGKYNIMNLGIFLWRLQAYPISQAQAFSHGEGRFTFSQLGQALPLFTHPKTEEDLAHVAEEVNVPGPIRRRALLDHPSEYIGENQSLTVWEGHNQRDIVTCNLTDWVRRPPSGKVAVDPVLGRLAFPVDEEPDPETVKVSYYYGFSSELGGGGYERDLLPGQEDQPSGQPYVVGKGGAGFTTLQAALTQWKDDGMPQAVVEFLDSGIYDEAVSLAIPFGRTLTIRAANHQRPVVRLSSPWTVSAPSPKETGGRLLVDGIMVAGDALEINKQGLSLLHLHHCTLVPGRGFDDQGQPLEPHQPSVISHGENLDLDIMLSRTISGSLRVPLVGSLTLTDSILDGLQGPAISTGVTQGTTNPVALHVEATTVFGEVSVGRLSLASNSIFTDAVTVERRQEGCVRFSYLPLSSAVPRRYKCQPDATVPAKAVRPRFTSRHYGQPGYGQLSVHTPDPIRTGADDQAEMGAFHHLQQPQREANLRASVNEYLRVGLDTGLFFVT